jgi:hypothetical protein
MRACVCNFRHTPQRTQASCAPLHTHSRPQSLFRVPQLHSEQVQRVERVCHVAAVCIATACVGILLLAQTYTRQTRVFSPYELHSQHTQCSPRLRVYRALTLCSYSSSSQTILYSWHVVRGVLRILSCYYAICSPYDILVLFTSSLNHHRLMNQH